MKEWLKADLREGKEAVIPLSGESVVLYCRPRVNDLSWGSDIGSLSSDEADNLIWESAFGIASGFDGELFEDILNDYDVWFALVPPLEAGRFPSPMTRPVNENA